LPDCTCGTSNGRLFQIDLGCILGELLPEYICG